MFSIAFYASFMYSYCFVPDYAYDKILHRVKIKSNWISIKLILFPFKICTNCTNFLKHNCAKISVFEQYKYLKHFMKIEHNIKEQTYVHNRYSILKEKVSEIFICKNEHKIFWRLKWLLLFYVKLLHHISFGAIIILLFI